MLVALLVLVGWFGTATPAHAIEGTSVAFTVLQPGIPTTATVRNTALDGTRYKQPYQTTRHDVVKTCPASRYYRLQVPGKGGTRLLAPGQCKTWTTTGLRTVGVFRASYVPPVDPPASDWPNATTTGFQGDVASLPTRRGWRVTTPGAVIENLRIDARDSALVIDAPNVTVRDVVIDVGIWGIDALHTADGLTVEDSTIVGGYQAGIGLDQTGGWLSGWTIQRVNMHSGRDAIKPSGTGVVRDSYLHDFDTGGDAHNDAMQFGDADGIQVLHNRMECADTSCIAMFENQGEFRDVTIEGNHMTGAGYILYAGGSSGSGIVVKDNVFGDWGWGPVTWFDVKPGNVWSGNVDLAGRPVNP
jgi:hypothetical protein